MFRYDAYHEYRVAWMFKKMGTLSLEDGLHQWSRIFRIETDPIAFEHMLGILACGKEQIFTSATPTTRAFFGQMKNGNVSMLPVAGAVVTYDHCLKLLATIVTFDRLARSGIVKMTAMGRWYRPDPAETGSQAYPLINVGLLSVLVGETPRTVVSCLSHLHNDQAIHLLRCAENTTMTGLARDVADDRHIRRFLRY